MAKDLLKKTNKAHTIYKTSDGKRVPGATTITGLLNKPYLIKWANDLGLEGIDATKYRDEAAQVGTLAHAMVAESLGGDKVDESLFSANDISLAQNSAISFFEWRKQHDIEPILIEHPMVSDTKLFGGTIDCYCKIDGVPTLLDFKTGKAIYDEYFVQLSAYKELLIENGYPVENCRILRIGRDETEGFEERSVADTTKYYDIFRDLLDIYYKKKELGWR